MKSIKYVVIASSLAFLLHGCGGSIGSEIEELFNGESGVIISTPPSNNDGGDETKYTTAEELMNNGVMKSRNGAELDEASVGVYRVDYEDKENDIVIKATIESDGKIRFNSDSGKLFDLGVVTSSDMLPHDGDYYYYYLTLGSKIYGISLHKTSATSSSTSSSSSVSESSSTSSATSSSTPSSTSSSTSSATSSVSSSAPSTSSSTPSSTSSSTSSATSSASSSSSIADDPTRPPMPPSLPNLG